MTAPSDCGAVCRSLGHHAGSCEHAHPAPSSLAAQVRDARVGSALSQRALATRAGVRQATVATIEGGANTDAATLAKLADALGVALTVHPGATPPERRAKR